MPRLFKVSLYLLLMISAGMAQAGDSGDRTKSGNLFRDFIQDGANFTPEDTGFDNDVRTIAVYNGDLIVAGYFFKAGGISTNRAAGWNGSNWYSMNGFHFGNPIHDLHEHDDGFLYAGQALTWLNSWDGSSWTHYEPSLGDDHFGYLWALETYNSELYVGGGFDGDPLLPSYLAKWNGTSWDSVGTGINWTVRSLTTYDGELVAGGFFKTSDGSVADRIAAWDGSTWSALGSGMPDGGVYAFHTFNGDLIAAGNFTMAGGTNASNIARWDGSAWYALGSGLNGWVEALTIHDGNLVVGGRFTTAGGSTANYIASWDGSSWSTIGTGFDDDVYALAIYNGYLIAGGAFTTAGGYVALWDGATWRPVSDIITDVAPGDGVTLPDGFALGQNRPNPFNPSTQIEFNIPYRAQARIEVINVQGQVVKELLNKSLAAGPYSVVWNGENATGKPVASGAYFYRLTIDGYAQSKKMILLK